MGCESTASFGSVIVVHSGSQYPIRITSASVGTTRTFAMFQNAVFSTLAVGDEIDPPLWRFVMWGDSA